MDLNYKHGWMKQNFVVNLNEENAFDFGESNWLCTSKSTVTIDKGNQTTKTEEGLGKFGLL